MICRDGRWLSFFVARNVKGSPYIIIFIISKIDLRVMVSRRQNSLLKNNKTAEGGISGVKGDVISLAGGE